MDSGRVTWASLPCSSRERSQGCEAVTQDGSESTALSSSSSDGCSDFAVPHEKA